MQFTVRHAASLSAPLAAPRPVLYAHTLCPYAQRVFSALLLQPSEAGGFEYVHVDLSNKPGWFGQQVSASGLVPALVTARNQPPLLESLDICTALAVGETSPLMPSAPAAVAAMQQLLERTPSIVSAGLDLAAGSTARQWGVGSRPSTSQQRRWDESVDLLQHALAQSGGPFLTGKQPSLADVALHPFMQRFQLCLQLDGRNLTPPLAAWLDALALMPAFALASPAPDAFRAALQRHRSLDFFDYETYSATQLLPHLQQFCLE